MLASTVHSLIAVAQVEMRAGAPVVHWAVADHMAAVVHTVTADMVVAYRRAAAERTAVHKAEVVLRATLLAESLVEQVVKPAQEQPFAAFPPADFAQCTG